MRRTPSFTLLRTFEAAARLQSFALAASELHVTPSAISHQMKELEVWFGRPLFVRRNRSVETTPAAARLFESLSRVFDVIETACNEVSLAPQAQVLVVHCAPSLAVKWLGPRLPDFARAHPHITMRLSTGAEAIDLTRMQEVDVTISYGAALDRAGIQTIALGDEYLVPLCSPRLLEGSAPPARSIAGLTLIDSLLSRFHWRDWFTENGLDMPRSARPSFDRAALSIAAAVDGMGVALESLRLAEREIARGELVEFGAGTFRRRSQPTHFLSFRQGDAVHGKIAAFREWICVQAGVREDA